MLEALELHPTWNLVNMDTIILSMGKIKSNKLSSVDKSSKIVNFPSNPWI
jgi:hypothetical protein